MENVTFHDFSVATDFVKDAMDEYYTTKNWTGLVERYWMLIEEQIGGESLDKKNKCDVSTSV